ncbi:hypothetical protein PCORN_16550 [Listeria cornellensis FSL F6-0969]|uniref:Uncharacterized protein n=1 Tax=Listeria cornellensis FSL F6-0969 TaxID=1265820 RepID=W7BL81_9LIST|nr:hypothetical protein PCORN_16550 [Listeria cornellensis FSL F6-0969]
MSLEELYTSESIQRDFESEKLLQILLDDQVYPIHKKRLILQKNRKKSHLLPIVYTILLMFTL